MIFTYWTILSDEDRRLAWSILHPHARLREPDKILAPDGAPYLYRWRLVHTPACCVYFHIQVRSDPERPLHDHPWDNTSTILAGGYIETIDYAPGHDDPSRNYVRRKGDVIFRRAEDAHRLALPEGVPYTMTMFSTGPKIREWGFWYPTGWVNADELCRQEGNVSLHTKEIRI